MARRTWLMAGALGLAVGAGLVGGLLAQPVPVPGPAPVPYIPFMPGRFVVARVDGANIVILDTATGGLYSAGPGDVKKYSDLPKAGAGMGPIIRPFPLDKAPPAIARPRPIDPARDARKER